MRLHFAKHPLMVLCIFGMTSVPSFSMDEEQRTNQAIPVARALNSIQESFNGFMDDVDSYVNVSGKQRRAVL